MKLSTELQERGFIYQFSTETLDEILDGPKRTVYLGIDPTAEAIHVGNLVAYMLLSHLMNAGHSVILLMGGGTALIGDPSGRDSEREFVDASVVAARAEKIEANIRSVVASDAITFVNNHDWLSKLSMIEFLRDVGKHFTVNAMMKKESVSARLASEQGISFTEFSYALLQAYDYYHLHTEYGCDLQIGGSDQWGNIISGVDYIRRTTGDEVYALTMPLVVDKTTGKKFGKSAGNAVWLDPALTSPYEFYQFWLNTADENVIGYLKLFTFLSLDEISVIEKEFAADPAARTAQKRLAEEVTTFVHGSGHTAAAKAVSELLFSGSPLTALDDAGREMLRTSALNTPVQEGDAVIDVLLASELAASKREARTFIEEGAVVVNDEKITDVAATVTASMFIDGLALVRRGKKHVRVLTFVS